MPPPSTPSAAASAPLRKRTALEEADAAAEAALAHSQQVTVNSCAQRHGGHRANGDADVQNVVATS